MKIRFFAVAGAFWLASSASAQAPETARATRAVRDFYRFHLFHDQSFSAQQIASRSRFFTPKLRRLFWNELKREQKYSKNHPTDKPQFIELPFQPIEFDARDYRVGAAQIRWHRASVNVDFVYGKSSPTSQDGTPVSYQILLAKNGEKWLIDDVIYDDAIKLTEALAESARLQ